MKLIFFTLVSLSILSFTGCSDSSICAGDQCQCEANGDCDFDCGDGRCAQQCAAGATCDFTCDGGVCTQQCLATSDKCTFSCKGGGCTQQCFGNSNCTKTCSGGGCIGDDLNLPL